MALLFLLAIPLAAIPFLMLYYIIRLAVKHGINDANKNNKTSYEHDYKYEPINNDQNK